MNKQKFKETLKKLNLTIETFAKIYTLSEIDVNKWNDKTKPVPEWVEIRLEEYRISKLEDFYTKSLTFLNIAENSAIKTKHKNFNTGEYQNVISYNVCTAFELFLKYAIGIINCEELMRSHNLSTLYEKYKELYPEDKYILQIPIYPTVDNPTEGLTKERIKEIKELNFDQMLKYPLQGASKSWKIGLTTKCDFSYIQASEKRFEEIFQLINQKIYSEVN